jgi:hypothetical protein
VHALQGLPPESRDLGDLVSVLQPDWLVLRPWELESLRNKFPGVADKYEIDRVFEVRGVPEDQLNQDGANTVSFAGLAETDVDEKFIVLKRVST